MAGARERIGRLVEKWFLIEPLLFSAWHTHALMVEPRIRNIRVGHGRIEYNPAFIDTLAPRQLESVLQFEALRILLKHPYARRKEDPRLSYEASNLALQESLRTELPVPSARARFGTDAYDRQYFEFYYAQLQSEQDQAATRRLEATDGGNGDGPSGEGSEEGDNGTGAGQGRETGADGADPTSIAAYADPDASGQENSAPWEPDELLTDRIDSVIREARESDRWGSVTGGLRERILATLRPVLDYRAVLRQFRTSILSQQRSLTRMKPSRRYGFEYLGSRRDFTTRLLVAVDVSGSMGTADLQRGFSLINRFFKYGIPQIDVIQFDTQITGTPMRLKQARHAITLLGRGGTDFSPVVHYADEHPEYDGVIIFTDGYAPVPDAPRNRRVRLLWLFVHESHYRAQYPQLKHLGKGAFLKEEQQSP